MKWHIGCSGFHYKEWKNEFYPHGVPQKKWFEYYSKQFDCLEVNVTFYRFPRVPALQGWYEKSPEGFLFAVKAPRLITHYTKFIGSKGLLADFYNTISDGLKEKLGAVLFQLPPNLAFSEEKMQQIIDSMNPAFTNVVEFRHASWWNKKIYDTFSKNKLCFCGISHPQLPEDAIVTTDVAYYRFHGVPNLYHSEYDTKKLRKISDSIKKQKVKDAYIFFNNTASMAAIHNADWLTNYCRTRRG